MIDLDLSAVYGAVKSEKTSDFLHLGLEKESGVYEHRLTGAFDSVHLLNRQTWLKRPCGINLKIKKTSTMLWKSSFSVTITKDF